MTFKFLKHAGQVVDFGRTGLILFGAALGQHNGRHRDHRAMRVSQHLVHGSGAGDSGKVGRAMSTQHDEVTTIPLSGLTDSSRQSQAWLNEEARVDILRA